MTKYKMPRSIALDISECVSRALHEDIGDGDITALLVPLKKSATAKIIALQPAVICGIPWAEEVFNQLNGQVETNWLVSEGEEVIEGDVIALLSGSARALLTGERTVLNFLQTLSGTASCARRYFAKVQDSSICLLDTRKTIPGLRKAQKYAVRIGGCSNHRMGLYDSFLIKENHILACGGIAQAIQKARVIDKEKVVEVEVENITQFNEAVDAQADIIMLDNFSYEDILRVDKIDKGRTKVEVSGGVTDELLAQYKTLPVDFISSGSLTKHIEAIDLSMRFYE
jgi:nicotinate-nucleotide pyrophosphorylase (carboxylating)